MSARVLALLQERRRVTPDFPELNKRGLFPSLPMGGKRNQKPSDGFWTKQNTMERLSLLIQISN